MNKILHLNLNLEKVILLRNALKLFLQTSTPESRPQIQELLDTMNLHIEVISILKQDN